MKCNMYYGRITPVQATEKMTVPVGQRLGKLFTFDDSSVLPEVTNEQNGWHLLIEHRDTVDWFPSPLYRDLLSALLPLTASLATSVSIGNNLATEIESFLGGF